MLLLHSSGNFLFSDQAVCLAVVCWITWEGTVVNSCMHKSVGFHIWSSKMDQMCVSVFALGQCVTGECTENKLPIISFSAGLFKCLSASSRRLRRMLTSGCCQFSVHVHLSWISSAEQGPQANIPLIFFHPWFISLASFLSNTWTPPPTAVHRGLKREENVGLSQGTFGLLWLGGRGHGSCGWGSCCLACPFVSLMTLLRKVSCSIQEALRVILPDDGHFPRLKPGGGEMF